MSEQLGRELGEALLAHPEHELYDAATPGDLDALEQLLALKLPAVYRGVLLVGSGGVLGTGELLLGTKDPDQLGATLHEVARGTWADGLPRWYLPFLDGDRFLCFDLTAPGSAEAGEVVEIDPESYEVLRRVGPFADLVRNELLAPPPAA